MTNAPLHRLENIDLLDHKFHLMSYTQLTIRNFKKLDVVYGEIALLSK